MPATRGLTGRLLRHNTRGTTASGASEYQTADEYHADGPAAPAPAAGRPVPIPAECRGEKRAGSNAAGRPGNPPAKRQKTAPNPAAAQYSSSAHDLLVNLLAAPQRIKQQQRDLGRKKKTGAAVYDFPTSDEGDDHDDYDHGHDSDNDDNDDDEGPKRPHPVAPKKGAKRTSKGKGGATRTPLPEIDTQEVIRALQPNLDPQPDPVPENGGQSGVREAEPEEWHGDRCEEAGDGKANIPPKKARKTKRSRKKKKGTEQKEKAEKDEEKNKTTERDEPDPFESADSEPEDEPLDMDKILTAAVTTPTTRRKALARKIRQETPSFISYLTRGVTIASHLTATAGPGEEGGEGPGGGDGEREGKGEVEVEGEGGGQEEVGGHGQGEVEGEGSGGRAADDAVQTDAEKSGAADDAVPDSEPEEEAGGQSEGQEADRGREGDALVGDDAEVNSILEPPTPERAPARGRVATSGQGRGGERASSEPPTQRRRRPARQPTPRRQTLVAAAEFQTQLEREGAPDCAEDLACLPTPLRALRQGIQATAEQTQRYLDQLQQLTLEMMQEQTGNNGDGGGSGYSRTLTDILAALDRGAYSDDARAVVLEQLDLALGQLRQRREADGAIEKQQRMLRIRYSKVAANCRECESAIKKAFERNGYQGLHSQIMPEDQRERKRAERAARHNRKIADELRQKVLAIEHQQTERERERQLILERERPRNYPSGSSSLPNPTSTARTSLSSLPVDHVAAAGDDDDDWAAELTREPTQLQLQLQRRQRQRIPPRRPPKVVGNAEVVTVEGFGERGRRPRHSSSHHEEDPDVLEDRPWSEEETEFLIAGLVLYTHLGEGRYADIKRRWPELLRHRTEADLRVRALDIRGTLVDWEFELEDWWHDL